MCQPRLAGPSHDHDLPVAHALARDGRAAWRLDEALTRDDVTDSLQQWATVMVAAALAADRGRPEIAAELLAAADATTPGHPLVHAERTLIPIEARWLG